MREVKTLWFRPMSWWEVPFFTLPFIGDVPFRRLAYIISFSVIGWFAGVLVAGTYGGLAGITAGFFAGFILGSPYKFLPPEVILMHSLSGPPLTSKRETKKKALKQALKPVAVSIQGVEEPVKVFGVVKDARGMPVANADVLLFVDGKPESKASTDWDGRFVFYAQLTPGFHKLSVKHGDVEVLRSLVRVEVRS